MTFRPYLLPRSLFTAALAERLNLLLLTPKHRNTQTHININLKIEKVDYFSAGIEPHGRWTVIKGNPIYMHPASLYDVTLTLPVAAMTVTLLAEKLAFDRHRHLSLSLSRRARP